MKKNKTRKLDMRFTSVLFGIILISSPFVEWKILAVFALGFLFLLARQRSCAMCAVSGKVHNR